MVLRGRLSIKSINVGGCGAIILTGPSGCGKGEIAKYLVNVLQLENKYHLSMGEILRSIIIKAKSDKIFLDSLSNKYKISTKISIFNSKYNSSNVILKAEQYKDAIMKMINDDPFFENKEIISQFAWLCYAVSNGLLVPKEWTNKVLEANFENNEEIRKSIFLLDGYPRTISAAQHMLKLFERLEIPIIKIIHLSITKREMLRRAQLRDRFDDNITALENRFQFYIEQVQPSVDEIKRIIGSDSVVLIDAHQPVLGEDDKLDTTKSIHKVAKNVIKSLELEFL